MTKAILRFGMVLLIGGNTLVQNEIFKLTSQDSKNILLVQLNELIRGCGDTIATFEGTKEAKGLDAEANYSDTYDFYIDNEKIMTRKFVFLPETVEEQREFDEKVAAMQYAFILLKNLCEGNN